MPTTGDLLRTVHKIHDPGTVHVAGTGRTPINLARTRRSGVLVATRS
jgi:hypothetical protein